MGNQSSKTEALEAIESSLLPWICANNKCLHKNETNILQCEECCMPHPDLQPMPSESLDRTVHHKLIHQLSRRLSSEDLLIPDDDDDDDDDNDDDYMHVVIEKDQDEKTNKPIYKNDKSNKNGTKSNLNIMVEKQNKKNVQNLKKSHNNDDAIDEKFDSGNVPKSMLLQSSLLSYKKIEKQWYQHFKSNKKIRIEAYPNIPVLIALIHVGFPFNAINEKYLYQNIMLAQEHQFDGIMLLNHNGTVPYKPEHLIYIIKSIRKKQWARKGKLWLGANFLGINPTKVFHFLAQHEKELFYIKKVSQSQHKNKKTKQSNPSVRMSSVKDPNEKKEKEEDKDEDKDALECIIDGLMIDDGGIVPVSLIKNKIVNKNRASVVGKQTQPPQQQQQQQQQQQPQQKQCGNTMEDFNYHYSLASLRIVQYNVSRFKYSNGLYFGGIDFKYNKHGQLKKDIDEKGVKLYKKDINNLFNVSSNGFMHCSVTTGKGNGIECDFDKIIAMCKSTKNRCMNAIASGVRCDNVEKYVGYCDCIMVGTGVQLDPLRLDEKKLRLLRANVIKKCSQLKEMREKQMEQEKKLRMLQQTDQVKKHVATMSEQQRKHAVGKNNVD